MSTLTFLDFFSGIGGFRKGFELCGMRCAGHCEIDKFTDRSYRAIHNVKEDEWYAADITKLAHLRQGRGVPIPLSIPLPRVSKRVRRGFAPPLFQCWLGGSPFLYPLEPYS